MNVWITGIAGELGSSLAKALADRGYTVLGNDIARLEEAWRLRGYEDRVKYVWKASQDLLAEDIRGAKVVIDCSAQPDRPLGISSPMYTALENVLIPLRICEAAIRCDPMPWLLYPSSGTLFLGVPPDEQPITEETQPRPTNPYSWSKWAAEEVYRTYGRMYNVSYVITRSGFVYGPGARLDIAIMKWILRTLRGQRLVVRSPEATRTPCFAPDVVEAWLKLIGKIESDPDLVRFETIHFVADKEYKMIEIAEKVREILGGDNEIVEGPYEPGELVNGMPVRQWEVNVKARKYLGWEAKTSLEEGIRKTAEWMADSGLV